MPRVEAATVAEHRRLVLGRMFQAFERLIYERGYDAVTLADVAKQAQLARTAIYNYFPDKESLLLAYTASEMDDFFSTLRTELFDVADPIDQLACYVGAQIRYLASHHLPTGPELRSVVSADTYAELASHARTLADILYSILAEAAAEGLVTNEIADDPETIRLVVACTAPAGLRDATPAQVEQRIVSAQAFIRRALGADPVAG